MTFILRDLIERLTRLLQRTNTNLRWYEGSLVQNNTEQQYTRFLLIDSMRDLFEDVESMLRDITSATELARTSDSEITSTTTDN